MRYRETVTPAGAFTARAWQLGTVTPRTVPVVSFLESERFSCEFMLSLKPRSGVGFSMPSEDARTFCPPVGVVGEGDGVMVGDGEGFTLGEGLGVALGDGEGFTLGEGLGVTEGLGLGLGDGLGVGEGDGVVPVIVSVCLAEVIPLDATVRVTGPEVVLFT